MKGFSFFIFFCFISVAFASEHPSCKFFTKESVFLFKMTKSNEKESLHFRVEADSNCLVSKKSKVKVFFKDIKGICHAPTFTYIRNNLGFKNYSQMESSIKSSNSTLYIPMLNEILKQDNNYKDIKYDTYMTSNGCSSDVYVQNANLRLYFDHIYQEVEYISVSEVELYKSKH